MANVYYGNNGVMDLMPETLDRLKGLPASWTVIVNVRPVARLTARELDAIVLTERAVHVLEFKRSEAPVTIATDGTWLQGSRPMRGGIGNESPAEQVVNSTDAFKSILMEQFPQLARAVFPWVVLEKYNPNNWIGMPSRRMTPNDWHDVGHAKVIHGVEFLETILKRKESKVSASLPTTEVQQLREALGAKPLGRLSVQGFAQLLDSQSPLAHARIQVTALRSGTVFETVTNTEGAFELLGLPLEPVEVRVPDFPDLRVLPGAAFQSRAELLVMHVFLLTPHISEDRIRDMLQAGLDRVTEDVNAMFRLAEGTERRVTELEQELAATRQMVQGLVDSPVIDTNEVIQAHVTGLIERIQRLERERRQLHTVRSASLDTVRHEALAPLQSELAALSIRVQHLEQQVAAVEEIATQATVQARQATHQVAGLTDRVDDLEGQTGEAWQAATNAYSTAESAARFARTAQGHAAVSESEAKRAAEEARRSKQVQAERLEHERLLHATEEERRKLRIEALKFSALVGTVGGFVSTQPLPFADNVLIAPMQIWLVVRIGQIYGQSVGQDAAVKLIGTLGFGFAAQHLTVAMYKFVPGFTFGLGPFTVFGFTVLLGYVTAMFYERNRMPDRSEQKAALKGIQSLLKDQAFATEVKELGRAVGAEFKARGYKTRPDDLKAMFEIASERARPIGERLERALFTGNSGNRQSQEKTGG